MNDIMTTQIEILSKNSLMVKALSELIKERIEKEKPTIERSDDDKMLGEKFRAYEQAQRILTGLLLDIESHNISKNKEPEQNRAN